VRQIGMTDRSIVAGSRMKKVYPVAIASEASSAARIECMGPRCVRKAASRLRIERASMSRLTLDKIRVSWRFVSSRKAWPRMKPKSACENTSIRSPYVAMGFVEESVVCSMLIYLGCLQLDQFRTCHGFGEWFWLRILSVGCLLSSYLYC